jgi:antitoxin ParD1/3/4
MATTDLSLDEHWRAFIEHQIGSGHYASATEVVEAGLRQLEARNERFARLRAHLAEGVAEADAGDVVEDYSIEGIIAEADKGGASD